MNDFEFMHYLPTPEEKYFKGIATVRFLGRILLKYKVIEKKDGSGYFVAAPNYRLAIDGDYKYVDAISIDSTMEKDALFDLIRAGINKAMNPSVHEHAQPKEQQQAQPAQEFQPNLDTCPF